MLYTVLFFVRYFPFWAVPAALVIFEIGMYHYNRRERPAFVLAFLASGTLVISSIVWIAFEGYWRAGPFVKRLWEGF